MTPRRSVAAFICLFAAAGAIDAPANPVPIPALPFFYDLYTFRNDDGRTTVVGAIAVQARRLRAERRDNETRYRFDLRFVLADTATREVFTSIDSVFVTSPGRLPGEHLLHTYIEVDAPPSSATLQRIVVTDASRPGVGQLYSTAFPVPDYSGSELMLSDIALGLPDPRAGWTRRGVTLALLPTSQFPESSFDVYYEIYNLPTDHQYDTEVAFEPADGSDDEDRTVRTLFSGESEAGPDGTVGELRHVQSGLPRGRHRLTVTVRDKVTGATAERTRLVEVRGWGEGTTLVPALPRGRRGVGQ